MLNRNFDAKTFWEKKILDWEGGRYAAKEEGQSFLERIANRSSDSLRFRLRAALEIIQPHVAGKTVLELGCGSGLIAQELIDAGAEQYIGIDFAEAAIDQANETFKDNPDLGSKIQFRVGDVCDPLDFKPDIAFSLGLLDWLDLDQIEQIFQNCGPECDYLHAISERKFSLSQIAHKMYVYVSYGHRTDGYQPMYYSTQEIVDRARPTNTLPTRIYRDKRLSFGAFVVTLDA